MRLKKFLYLLLAALTILCIVYYIKPKFFDQKEMETTEFKGTWETGKQYRARWPVDDQIIGRLPMHHAANIEWINTQDFPGLDNETEIIFEFVSRNVYQVPGENRWNEEIKLKIINIITN